MKDKILKQIEEEVKSPLSNYINDKHTQEECVGFIDGFNEGYKACYNTKESVDEKLVEVCEELIDFAIKNGYVQDIPKGQKEGLIDSFEKSIRNRK